MAIKRSGKMREKNLNEKTILMLLCFIFVVFVLLTCKCLPIRVVRSGINRVNMVQRRNFL